MIAQLLREVYEKRRYHILLGVVVGQMFILAVQHSMQTLSSYQVSQPRVQQVLTVTPPANDETVASSGDSVRVSIENNREVEEQTPPFGPDTPILEAKYFLTKLKIPEATNSTNRSVRATFCPLDWSVQKSAPNTVPRYKNVVQHSDKLCYDNKIELDFADIVRKAREYDIQTTGKVHSLNQTGFIFHESRSGSTLVANMLTVADPVAHRVYSEPGPLLSALEKEDTKLVEDVLYMMGRSNDAREKHVFYKLRSTAVHYIDSMPSDVPWIFLYRDPEQVMASHFNPTEAKAGIVCLQGWKHAHPLIVQIAREHGKEVAKTTEPEYCATRLASMCAAAIQEHKRTGRGRFYNYDTLPSSLWETILPGHFGVELDSTQIDRMKEISGVYSKGKDVDEKEWKADSSKKSLSAKRRKAARMILSPYYDEMEAYARETPGAGR